MKKTLTFLLLISLSTAPLLGGERERNIGSAAEGGAHSGRAMSMMGWGAGLALVIGGLAALFSSSSGSSSGHCAH